MTCQWCSRPSDKAFHDACWRLHQQAESRKADRLYYEFRQALETGDFNVSGECRAKYSQQLDYQQANRGKGRKGKVEL